MKIHYIFFVCILTLTACKSNSDKTESANSTESVTKDENQTHNHDESLDPNELIKNNQSAESTAPLNADGSAAAITFENKEKEFGTINEGEQVELSYKFTNTGGSDLIITQCQAGCGCTVPNWPKDPIKPGKTGIINVKFDSNGKSGHNEKHVTVMSNAVEHNVDLIFRGEVKPKY